MTTMIIEGSSAVRLHELHIRPDGDEWVVGRIDIGEFVALPVVGVRAIDLLREGCSVEVSQDRLVAEGLGEIDVADFVTELAELGFVAAIDGREVASLPPIRPTFPWLRPAHTRWVQGRAIRVIVGVVIAAGLIAAVTHPHLLPTPEVMVWSTSGSLVLLGQAILFWTLIFIHELAHLAAARAVGVPGRIRLSTRLHFLVAQTDVTGIWAANRTQRMTVYLAGMALDASIASIATLVVVVANPTTAVHRISAIVLLSEVLLLAPQLLIFMRTDLYFVLQDLTRSRNLYADGSAFATYLAGRLWRRSAAIDDPSRQLPRGERRAVRGYTVLLVVGTAACLGVAVGVSLPVALHLIWQAVHALSAGSAWLEIADALATILVVVGFQLLWCRLWWRRHGARIRRWTSDTAAHLTRRSTAGRR
ncbi:hypothetical protein ABNF97_09675 [Plantactinospora sp. B6F1]|uniref:hypothetical protein n=1 Tax=Plantactinospora sp. B6F1 TaxID=3158971 RepID=UPI00102B117F